jgi:hypothetical protein
MRTILTGLVLLAAATPAQAQMIWGGEYERAARPGVYIPYDGEPYSHHYYTHGVGIYLTGDGWRLWDVEYWDRVERAYKFGYRLPTPRYVAHPQVVEEVVVEPGAVVVQPEETVGETVIEEASPVRGRFGLGRWRRR